MDNKQHDTVIDVDQNTPDIPANLSPNHIAYAILRDKGFNNSDASEMLKFSRANGSIIDRKLNKRYDITTNKALKLASKAHEKILGCFVHPDKIKNDSTIDLKGSDVTKAIDRVYDRVQPVKRDQAPSSVSFIQINLEAYK